MAEASLLDEIIANTEAASSDVGLPGEGLVGKLINLANADRRTLIALRTEAELAVGDVKTVPPSPAQLQRHFGRLAHAAAYAKVEFGPNLPTKLRINKEFPYSLNATANGPDDGTLTYSYQNILDIPGEDLDIALSPNGSAPCNFLISDGKRFEESSFVYDIASYEQINLLSVLYRFAAFKGYGRLKYKEFLREAITDLKLKGAVRKKNWIGKGSTWVLCDGEVLAQAVE